MSNIEVIVHSKDDEPARTIAVPEDATIEELLRVAFPDAAATCHLVIEDEPEPRPRHHRLNEVGIRPGHRLHIHRHEIEYTVDGEKQITLKHLLTAGQIMENAKVDPATHYLIRLLHGGGEEKYLDNSTVIHLHDRMAFLTALTGGAPLSGL